MGLHINVFRSDLGDCTNGGVSSTHNTLCVVNVSGPFEPSGDRPPVMLESHMPGILRIVPAYLHYFKDSVGKSPEWRKVPMHSMAGGNFGHTSDSRFAVACHDLIGHHFYGAVAIHDRYE